MTNKKVLDKFNLICYNTIRKKKKGVTKMKMNLWKSTLSGVVYEMPVDWLPQFGGWELVGTIEKEG